MIFPCSTMLPCSRPLTDQCLNPIRRAKRSFWEAFGQDHNLDRPAKRFHWDPLFQPAKKRRDKPAKRRLSGLEEYFARIRENTAPPYLMPPPVPLRELIEKFPLSNFKSRCFGSEAEQPPQIPIEVVVHDNSPKNTEGQKFMSNIIKSLYSGVKLNCDEARNTEYEARNREFRKTGDYECPMCLKNDGHSPVSCPYSFCVPKVDGKPVPVGPGYDIVCRACGGQACFDDHGWDVRAVGKRCIFCCSSFDHWSDDCPNKLSGMEAYEAFKLKTIPIGPPVRRW